MKHIPLPKKFSVEETEAGKKAKIIIEPCFPGYGMTLGNALRRVLLSSLPGGAVTAIKIQGTQHEFSAIEDVSEDVVDIILNLKQLRVRVHTEEPVTLTLSTKGQKKVTAGDISETSDVEIINKDLVIASLNGKEADMEMEITVAKGVGYVPTEERQDEKGEIGLILVDSIFTPVVNVGLEVEATRVGQKTDYDKIVLDVETDGTVSPEEATQKAAEILYNQFEWVMGGGTKEVIEVELETPTEDRTEDEVVVEDEAVAVAEKVEVESPDDIPSDDGEAEVEKPKKRGRPKKTEE